MTSMRIVALALAVAACGSDATGNGGGADGAGAGDAPGAADGPRGDDGGAADASPNGETTPTLTMVGTPIFEFADYQIYSGPQGTASDGGPAIATLETVWSAHLYSDALNVVGPDTAHAGPYAGEVSAGLRAAGIDPGNNFPMSDWEEPLGLFISTVMVPRAGAPTGASPDFASGPIIPDTIFPITVGGSLSKEGTVIDGTFVDTPYPTIDEAAPGAGADGWSHMPLNWGNSTTYVAGTPGAYTFDMHVRDKDGNGWDAAVPFTIR